MSSGSSLLQFFAIAILIHSAFGTSCDSPQNFQHASNYRSWQVSIVYSGQRDQFNPLQCSGTILNDRFVITAAHCLYDLNGEPVPLPMLQIQSVNNVAISRLIARVYHPKKFNVERLDDDVVLLKLDRPLAFNRYVAPICLDFSKLESHPESLTLDKSHADPESELDLIDLSTLTTANCNMINSLIFSENFENSLCAGGFEASQTYHRTAGMALMIRANDTLFIGGVGLYTTGSSRGNISFAGGISLKPYAVWIDTVINRHLRPSVSEQKCQEYSAAGAGKERVGASTMWIPSVLLLDDQMNYFKPSCYATLISEQFLLTMARCKSVTTNIQIQYGLLHADLFSKFEFHINPSDQEGLALVKLPRNPRQFNQVINCLWTEEDTPVQFEVQIKHAYSQTTKMYFRAEYIPTKPIKLVNINRCYHVSSMIMSSAPGDAVVLKRDNETLPRVVGLTTSGFGGCYDQTAENVAEKLDWIEGIVWGKL